MLRGPGRGAEIATMNIPERVKHIDMILALGEIFGHMSGLIHLRDELIEDINNFYTNIPLARLTAMLAIESSGIGREVTFCHGGVPPLRGNVGIVLYDQDSKDYVSMTHYFECLYDSLALLNSRSIHPGWDERMRESVLVRSP